MRKVKKNKMMFNELLNAMDMVGFLDEVTSNFVWFFFLSSKACVEYSF